MHPPIRMPRFLAWALLIAILVSIGAAAASAQEKLPPPGVEDPGRTEVIGIGQTRVIQMSTKAPLKLAISDSPAIVGTEAMKNDPTSVLITGKTQGRAVVTLTDVNNKVERVVVVIDDAEQRKAELQEIIRKIAPTATVHINVAKNAVILTGNVSDVDTAQRIMEAARGIFAQPTAVVAGPGGAPTPVSSVTIYNGMRVVGVQTVQLEVVVAVVNRSLLRTMNFNFAVNGGKYVFSSVLGGPFNFANTLTTGIAGGSGTITGNPNINFGVFGNKDSFTGYLGALNTEGLAKILADTKVTTLSGRPGKVVSGGETPILTSTGQGAPTVAYKQFGTVVNFLPIVQDGRIHLEVRPELSAINQANGITIQGVVPTVIPGFSVRQAEVAVQLEDGQTLAIGGLIQNTVNATIQRVPVLGNLPFVGVAFTNKSYKEDEEELLILVTPRLVDGISCTQIPKNLPGRESRSPDDFELFLEGIMEAPRGPRTVQGHPRDYKGAHMLSPNIGQIPCAGATGGCAAPGCLNGGPVGAAVSLPAPVLAMPLSNEATPAPVAQPLPTGALPERTSATPPIRETVEPVAPTLPAPLAPPRSLEPRPVLPPVTFGPASNDER
jgi:pilus assembly protein CpaC